MSREKGAVVAMGGRVLLRQKKREIERGNERHAETRERGGKKELGAAQCSQITAWSRKNY